MRHLTQQIVAACFGDADDYYTEIEGLAKSKYKALLGGVQQKFTWERTLKIRCDGSYTLGAVPECFVGLPKSGTC